MPLYALSDYQLNQRPGHRIGDPTEIALREGIVTRDLGTNAETDPERHRSGPGKILLKAGKEFTKSALTPAEEGMHVLGLSRPRSVRSVRWKGVALQHDDMLEVVGESARRRQAGHPGADHDGLPADLSGDRQRLRRRFFFDPRATMCPFAETE